MYSICSGRRPHAARQDDHLPPAALPAKARMSAPGDARGQKLGAGQRGEARLRERARHARPRRVAGRPFDEGRDTGQDDMTNFCLRADTNKQSVMVTDRNGVIEYVNPAFERMTGYPRSEAVGQPARLLNSGMHKPEFFAELWRTLLEGREFNALFANRRRDGEIFHEEKTIRPFVDRFGHTSHFVAVGQPIQAFVQSTLTRLEHLANHDALTGLPNRSLFLDRLRQHCSRATRRAGDFALAFVDLDEFKEINDSFGRDNGDFALRTIARRMHECMRAEDTVAHLGGDQFAIILSEIDDHGKLRQILEKLLTLLGAGFHLSGKHVPIRASIGVSTFVGCGERSAEGMLRLAEQAMNAGKRRGGNQVLIENGDGTGFAALAGASSADDAGLPATDSAAAPKLGASPSPAPAGDKVTFTAKPAAARLDRPDH